MGPSEFAAVDGPCQPLPPVTEVATDLVQRGSTGLVALHISQAPSGTVGAERADDPQPAAFLSPEIAADPIERCGSPQFPYWFNLGIPFSY